jgi:2,4-dienoyl-CoA reductase (NADPH2)
MERSVKLINLKNPFIFPPIKLGYSDGNGNVTDKYKDFYTIRSQYLGAMILEPLYIDKGLREIPTQLGIDHDERIYGLQVLIDAIHQSGARTVAHLNHPGRMANPKIPGNYYFSSTDRPCENGGATPKRMSIDEISMATELFVNAAKRAQESHFDMLELQFGHGYLAAQFISPFVNDRTDQYGGTFENRIKFPLEIFEAVKQSVELPIIVRISGDEMLPQGIQLSEMVQFSKILEAKGVEAIHVSAGSVCSTPPWFFQHMFIAKGKTWEMGREIQKHLNIPVIFVGRVNTFEDIDKLKDEFLAGYIAIGRALIADPKFVGKYLKKETGKVRPCLACAEGCLGGVRSGQGLQCLVNPEVGREHESFKVLTNNKKYAVVGGGLAGMEAAIMLKKRGYKVDLYEKEELGGQFNLAPLTPHKSSMARLVPYFVSELKDKKINIILKEANREDILKNRYDGLVLATGSRPSVPPIDGLNHFYWADILKEENLPENKKILIIGGGLIGVDIATALIQRGNQIIIVKRTTDFGEDMEMIAKSISLKLMNEKGTIFSDHTNIKKIEGNTVFAERNGEKLEFKNIDIIVVSTGMKSYNPLEEGLRDELPVFVIGDAKKVGNAQDAIRDAYDTIKAL